MVKPGSLIELLEVANKTMRKRPDYLRACHALEELGFKGADQIPILRWLEFLKPDGEPYAIYLKK